jgi:glutathione S-transferase
MHAGFPELRDKMPMNIRASYPGKGMTPAVRAEIERITSMWRDTRKRFAGAAPKDDGFLFGHFTAADAMYAPVVLRLRTYEVELPRAARIYQEAMLGLPALQEWIAAAERESESIPQFDMYE